VNTQNELFAELVKLKSENPDMDVVFMVKSDEVALDFKHTAHRIDSVSINYIRDTIHGYVIGDEDILYDLYEKYGDNYPSIEHAMIRMKNGIKKAIIVYTGAL
jgi:hypothetical protein